MERTLCNWWARPYLNIEAEACLLLDNESLLLAYPKLADTLIGVRVMLRLLKSIAVLLMRVTAR